MLKGCNRRLLAYPFTLPGHRHGQRALWKAAGTQLIPLMLSSYAFKVTFAALDTPLFYLGVDLLKDRVAPADEPAALA